MVKQWTVYAENSSPYRRRQSVILPIPMSDEPFPKGHAFFWRNSPWGEIKLPFVRVAALHRPGSTGIPNARWVQLVIPFVIFDPWEKREFDIRIKAESSVSPVKVEELIDNGEFFEIAPVCEKLLSNPFIELEYDGKEVRCPLVLNGSRVVYDWGAIGKCWRTDTFIRNDYNDEIWLRVYLTNFLDEPFFRVTLVLENQPYNGIKKEDPDAAVATSGIKHGVFVKFPVPAIPIFKTRHFPDPSSFQYKNDQFIWNLIPLPAEKPIETLGYWQGRVWEFILLKDNSSISATELLDKINRSNSQTDTRNLDLKLTTFIAQCIDPLYSVPDIQSVRESEAFWIGGVKSPLAPVDTEEYKKIRRIAIDEFKTLIEESDWGTWGEGEKWRSFGDVRYSGETGTPRNSDGDPWARRAIQSRIPATLAISREIARAQALRPMTRCLLDIDKSKLNVHVYIYNLGIHPRSDVRFHVGENSYSPYYAGKDSTYPGFQNNPLFYEDSPHGWTGPDYQHITFDQLESASIFCIDPFSYDELRYGALALPYGFGVNDKGFGDPHFPNPRGRWPVGEREEGWSAVAAFLAYSVSFDFNVYYHFHHRWKLMDELRRSFIIETTDGKREVMLEHASGANYDFRVAPFLNMVTQVFEAGSLLYGSVAIGYPAYGLSHMEGLWKECHGFGYPDQPDILVYRFEKYVLPPDGIHKTSTSWDFTQSKPKPRCQWYRVGVIGKGTFNMITGATLYAKKFHPDEKVREYISENWDTMKDHPGYGIYRDINGAWRQWWDI